MKVFEGINQSEINKLLNCFNAKTMTFKKNSTILYNVTNSNTLGIILKGKADFIRVDYNGDKSVIETIEENDIFESKMFNIRNNELSLIAIEDSIVIMIEYDKVINRCHKNCPYHNKLIDNIYDILVQKINSNYLRIELLTKKTIREKLLEYFKYISNEKKSKTFKLPINFSQLANYLSVDRSALMREIKNLKEDNIIEINNKIIKIKLDHI